MIIRWEIPDTWGTMKLGKIAPEKAGKAKPSDYPLQQFNYWGLGAIAPHQFTEPAPNWILGSEVASTCVKFNPSHVLYSRLRPYLNKVIIPTIDGIGSTEWVTLKPKSSLLDRHYLAYTLRTNLFLQYANSGNNTAGARLPRMRKPALKDADIPIPYPDDPKRSLIEQRRIVNVIEALLEEVREIRNDHQGIAHNIDQLMRSTIFHTFPENAIGDSDWQWVPIGDLGKVRGGATPRKSNADYWNGDISWVSPKDMKAYVIGNSKDHITELALDKTGSVKLIPTNSILIVFRSGILAHTLPIALTSSELTINQDMKAITPKEEYIPEYIAYALRAREQYILHNCVKKGPTVHSIIGDRFWKAKIPVPSGPNSLEIQKRIVARLDSVWAGIVDMQSLHQGDSILISQLEQSILEQAFRGEL